MSFSFLRKFEIHQKLLTLFTKSNPLIKFFNIDSSEKKIFFSDSSLLFSSISYSYNYPYLLNKFLTYDKFFSFTKDLSIKRIKFKPGYMKIWREARQVFQNSFFLKFKYQYRLTNFFLRIKNLFKGKFFNIFNLSLLNTLISAKFIFLKSVTIDFIYNNYVYVNGKIINNISYVLFKNDFIQLIISLKYYFFYKHSLNFIIINKLKMKHILNYKMIEEKNFWSQKKKVIISQIKYENVIFLVVTFLFF